MNFGRSYNLGGSPYTVAGQSGTIAAALAQDSFVYGLRAKAQTAQNDRLPLQIDAMWISVTTIVAFTVPVTAGRRLGVFKATGGTPNTGIALAPTPKWTKDAGADDGTDVAPQIANAGALAANGCVRGALLGLIDLAAFGAAGARVDKFFSFLDRVDGPVLLEPGEAIVLSNPVLFDAAGTWQLTVELDYKRRG